MLPDVEAYAPFIKGVFDSAESGSPAIPYTLADQGARQESPLVNSFMGVGQVLTMPLFFASNAIYPTEIMPGWLKVVSRLNPLTYVVDALRTFMLAGTTSSFGVGFDYAVMLIATTILVLIGARLYPHLAT